MGEKKVQNAVGFSFAHRTVHIGRYRVILYCTITANEENRNGDLFTETQIFSVTLFGKIIDVLVKGFLTENRALLKVKFSNSPKIRIHFSVTRIFSENERAFSVKFRSSHKKALHVDPICDAAPPPLSL